MSTKKKPAVKELPSTVQVPSDIEKRRNHVEALLQELNNAIFQAALNDDDDEAPNVPIVIVLCDDDRNERHVRIHPVRGLQARLVWVTDARRIGIGIVTD